MAKGNPETRPTKVAQVAAGGELSPLSLDPSVCVSTRDMLVFLLTSTLLALLLSIFVEVLSRRAEGPGLSSLPTDLGSELGALTAVAWPQSLPGNPSPASSHCGARLPKVTLTPLIQYCAGDTRDANICQGACIATGNFSLNYKATVTKNK